MLLTKINYVCRTICNTKQELFMNSKCFTIIHKDKIAYLKIKGGFNIN